MKNIITAVVLSLAVLVAAKAQTPAIINCPPDPPTAKIYASQEINLGNGFTATNSDFEAKILYPAATAGRWSASLLWTPHQHYVDMTPSNTEVTGMVGIHTHVLPSGKVLSWEGHNDNAHISSGSGMPLSHVYDWNPSANTYMHYDNYQSNIFCSGHSFLPDGRLLTVGGHYSDGEGTSGINGFAPGYIGLADANIFAYRSTTPWVSSVPSMSYRRWYPTATTLSNGEVLVVAGQQTGPSSSCPTCPAVQAELPELWKANSTWQTFNGSGAARRLPLYPWMFLAPDGRVFNAGPNVQTGFFNPTTATINGTAAGAWSDGQRHLRGGAMPLTLPVATLSAPDLAKSCYDYLERIAGTACMYQPGKIMIMGGAGPDGVTKKTEFIDLTVSTNPAWTAGNDMKLPRTHVNSTILADGSVLVTGGSGEASSSDNNAMYNAELWTPPAAGTSGLGTWTLMAPMARPRLYHSTAVLLPDATVLSAGGGQGGGFTDHPDYEIFTPPYLCKGYARPQITSVPQAVAYGQTFTVTSPDAFYVRRYGRATLVRLSSVTHSFNMNQRFLELTPTAGTNANELRLNIPMTTTTGGDYKNICPPGHYMLFLINDAGVPSVASIISINTTACTNNLVITQGASVAVDDCTKSTTVTVGGGAGGAYAWTVNGNVVSGTGASIAVTTTANTPNAQVQVEQSASCGASSSLRSFFPSCPYTLPKQTPPTTSQNVGLR